MSRRSQGTAAESARPAGFSRRQLMAGSAALSMLPNTPLAADPAIAACETWLARQRERQSLSRRWQKLETRLVRERDWFNLTRRQRAALPEAAELDVIDDRLDVLAAQNEELLAILPGIAAITAQGLALKLAVAVAHVPPEENKDAHDLIASILRDLQTIARMPVE